MIPEYEVKAMLERAEKATPGPWRKGSPRIQCLISIDGHRHGEGNCKYEHTGWYDFGGIYQDRKYGHGAKPDDDSDEEAGLIAGMWDYEEGGVRREEDQEFIAHARTDLPRLAEAYLELVENLKKIAEWPASYPANANIQRIREFAGAPPEVQV